MKKAILMPLFSLPGRHGRGSLGECAYAFVDKLAAQVCEYWVMPPFGDNYAYAIDLDLLRMDGLLTDADCGDLDALMRAGADRLLRKAYSAFRKPQSYADFEREHGKACGGDGYTLFLRYEFDLQWRALVDYARARGVTVTHSMPADAQVACGL